MTRIVIIGAGAVGGNIAVRLHAAGVDVAVVARGAHGDSIRRNGLVAHDPVTSIRAHLECVPKVADVGWRDDDIVILATKTQDAIEVLEDLVEVAPGTPVVCATNGVEAERVALRRFDRVYGVAVMMSATYLDPGVVLLHHHPVAGVLDVGRYPFGTDDVSRELTRSLLAVGFDCVEDNDVMRVKRGKLLVNLRNSVDALCGPAPEFRELHGKLQREGEAVLAAAGAPYVIPSGSRYDPIAQIRPAGGISWEGGSTSQSLRRGATRTEVDYLNGEIVMLGRLHGVATPLNELMQDLCRATKRKSIAITTPQQIEDLLAERTTDGSGSHVRTHGADDT